MFLLADATGLIEGFFFLFLITFFIIGLCVASALGSIAKAILRSRSDSSKGHQFVLYRNGDGDSEVYEIIDEGRNNSPMIGVIRKDIKILPKDKVQYLS